MKTRKILIVVLAFGLLAPMAMPSKAIAGDGLMAGALGIVPGLGHLYLGQPHKALPLMVLGGLSVWGTMYFYNRAQDAQTAYTGSGAGIPEAEWDKLYDDMHSKEFYNHLFFGLTLGVVCLSVIDAGWQGSQNGRAKLRITPEKLEVAYAIKF